MVPILPQKVRVPPDDLGDGEPGLSIPNIEELMVVPGLIQDMQESLICRITGKSF